MLEGGIENNLGVIVSCRNRGTLITCKVQYLDAEGSIAVLAGQDDSTDFPLLAFCIYFIEFQGIQTADADIGLVGVWIGSVVLKLRVT